MNRYLLCSVRHLEAAERNAVVRLGGWCFRHRGWLPAPLIIAALVVGNPTNASLVLGSLLMLFGEAGRIWAARHIGRQSRTRDEGAGALACGGPYRYVRNPLYVFNLLLHVGVAIAMNSIAAWVLPLGIVALYAVVVRWEETQVLAVHGDNYRTYTEKVGRFLPTRPPLASRPPTVSLAGAISAERGTFVVMAVVLSAIWSRSVWPL